MTDNTLYRFTYAEFFVMLSVAGADNCTVFFPESEPDDAALIRALISLYQRGMLRREGNCFVPDGAGLLFSSLRTVNRVALLRTTLSGGRTALCYLLPDHLWMAELLRDGCRIQKLRREEMSAWLIDSGILNPPVLDSLDLSEMTELYREELADPQGECLLRIEKQHNGKGDLIREYRVLRGPGVEILLTLDGVNERVEFCSRESLEAFLEDCFCDR